MIHYRYLQREQLDEEHVAELEAERAEAERAEAAAEVSAGLDLESSPGWELNGYHETESGYWAFKRARELAGG